MIEYSDKTKKITCKFNASIYSVDVVFKCFYWYGDFFLLEIYQDKNDILVVIEKKEGYINKKMYLDLAKRIKQDIVDFKTRDIVTKETKNIRELIIAKAFSNLPDEIEENLFLNNISI